MDFSPAVSLLKEFEGFRDKAYWDKTGKVWTIGYGETVYPDGQIVRRGDACTRAKAAEWMIDDIKTERLPAMHQMIKVPLTNNQVCALISFCYNEGIGNFKTSTLLRKLNAKRPEIEVANEFAKWTKSGGVELPGLVRRRKAEKALFLCHLPAEIPETV